MPCGFCMLYLRKSQDEKLIDLVIEMKAPEAITAMTIDENVIPIVNYSLEPHGGGLYKRPIAA